MKLIRYGAEGQEKPGVIIDEKYYDVSHLVNDYDEKFFSGNAIEELKEKNCCRRTYRSRSECKTGCATGKTFKNCLRRT